MALNISTIVPASLKAKETEAEILNVQKVIMEKVELYLYIEKLI